MDQEDFGQDRCQVGSRFRRHTQKCYLSWTVAKGFRQTIHLVYCVGKGIHLDQDLGEEYIFVGLEIQVEFDTVDLVLNILVDPDSLVDMPVELDSIPDRVELRIEFEVVDRVGQDSDRWNYYKDSSYLAAPWHCLNSQADQKDSDKHLSKAPPRL